MQKEIAILAGGCFWGMQELLRKFPGVISTRVGYTGGDVPNATYHKHGTHAEAVEVVFDADVISYRGLLKYFFKIHDPTTLDRQGNDVGSSYRSEIFYASSKQKEIALELIKDLEASGIWPGKIVTKVSKASDFWEAEEYHQDYLQKNPNGYTCHFERDEWVLSKKYDLNRSDIIIESIRSYIQAQEEREFYESFDKSCKDLKEVLEDSSKSKKLVSIEELLDEL